MRLFIPILSLVAAIATSGALYAQNAVDLNAKFRIEPKLTEFQITSQTPYESGVNIKDPLPRAAEAVSSLAQPELRPPSAGIPMGSDRMSVVSGDTGCRFNSLGTIEIPLTTMRRFGYGGTQNAIGFPGIKNVNVYIVTNDIDPEQLTSFQINGTAYGQLKGGDRATWINVFKDVPLERFQFAGVETPSAQGAINKITITPDESSKSDRWCSRILAVGIEYNAAFPTPMVHGFHGDETTGEYYVNYFRANGFPAEAVSVRMGDLNYMAQQVEEQMRVISNRWWVVHFNFITHSMGGLMVRKSITNPLRGYLATQVQNIAVPHGGAVIADIMLSGVKARLSGLLLIDPAGRDFSAVAKAGTLIFATDPALPFLSTKFAEVNNRPGTGTLPRPNNTQFNMGNRIEWFTYFADAPSAPRNPPAVTRADLSNMPFPSVTMGNMVYSTTGKYKTAEVIDAGTASIPYVGPTRFLYIAFVPYPDGRFRPGDVIVTAESARAPGNLEIPYPMIQGANHLSIMRLPSLAPVLLQRVRDQRVW